MSCQIKLGLCAVLCLLIIFVLDVCEAECDEYIIVFEENPCPVYRLKPMKKQDINWDEVSYPCNSTDRKPINKKCVVEFDYTGTTFSCQNHIKVVNHQTHSFKEDDHATKMIERKTEPLDVPINITGKEKPHHTVNEEFNTSIYDINLIYVYEDKIQNSSETTDNKTILKDQILRCDYAETVCVEEGNPGDNSLSDVTNKTLQISINRDTTSPVQPIFTGYFSQSSNITDSRNNNNDFTDLKTVTLHCKLFKDKNCKQNIKNKSLKLINIYIKTNYIQNNTITKYPNCTKDNITSEKKLNVKCVDILFTKHNQHILLTPLLKQDHTTWTCQIAESDSLSKKEKHNKMFFKNCFNAANLTTKNTKYEDNIVKPPSDGENKTTYDILINDGTIMDKTKMPSEIFELNKDNVSDTNPGNTITILVTEKDNNCSRKPSLNIHEGKIIDLGLNNDEENNLQYNNIELVLSNCIHFNSSAINNKQPHSKAELTIILKNESLNTSVLKQFNDTPTETSFKDRILLRCNSSNNKTSNRSLLQCESIDLDYYNITGVEINSNLNLNQTSNNKSALEPKNKIKQDVLPWHCKILEVNDTISATEQHSKKSKLYFNNCTNDVNFYNSKSKSGDINVTLISGDKPISTSETKKAIKINMTEIPSEKFELNKDNLPHTYNDKNISILLTEKENNCSRKSSLNIHEGKIIDLGINNIGKSLKNNYVQIVLSNCINVNNNSIINETQPHPKTELIIILKNESLNTSNLKQFNGTLEEDNVKQRILLRCDDPNHDSNSHNITNKTLVQCESIDLDLYNITGIEIDTKTKEVNAEVNKNSNNNTYKAIESHESTVNNKSTANNTKVAENKEIKEKNSVKKQKSNNLMFNRRKDIPDGAGDSNLRLGSAEPESIMLITLLTIVGLSILIIIALRIFPKKKGYNVAPTREPPDEEETAF